MVIGSFMGKRVLGAKSFYAVPLSEGESESVLPKRKNEKRRAVFPFPSLLGVLEIEL